MKMKISAKIAIRCGRAMSKLFYKFPISTDPFKFCATQLLDDDDLGTMMEIWWSIGSVNPQPVELFAELADLEPVENVSPISQYREFDFDLNVGWTGQLECDGMSQIPKIPNYGGSSFSDPDVDEVPDDIDDEGPKEVEDVHSPSFCNPSHGIILRNEPGGNMLNVDPDAAHASEFPEYADIVPAHRLALNSQFNELFVGQQFENKADCVFAIKQYSMKLSIDYKVAKSTPTLYVGECWRADNMCGWRVHAAFIQMTQQWQIRKLEGRHICTIARMSQDHRKLDAKSICNCIMPLVKDSPIIPVSTLIADMQARFQYRVSYKKAWWAKQMAMQQLYGDWDESYNELQSWISAMVEYVPGTVVDLQTLPYRGPNGELKLGKRVFHRLFWTFDPCVMAFSHCKPVVEVDGTWLYGKYTQILLIAVAQNGNRNIEGSCCCNSAIGGSVEVSNLNAKNGVETSKTVRGRTRNISVVGQESRHGPMELISKIGGVSAGCSKHYGNEFPVLRDISTWEMQSPAFEMLSDRSLRRRVKGRPTITRIQNDMDVREQVDPKRCTICRTVGHNRSKCPHGNVYTGQSSRSKRN
ncbi:uncharacterized protein [Gossypium hirsutum]|uniref:Transposase MuDR plant domain-containing protein n=1 Tax=Gossypium hirsutum TaxID=3635 RepID=A0A1U8IBB8_GOSHI|nr:uncharacterized protein LOC107892504 [Gossypium hirsutum]